MGKRGPSPTPTKKLAIQGSKLAIYGPGRSNELEHIRGVPECPDYLSDEAKREWEFVVCNMTQQMLNHVDRSALARYCYYQAEFVWLSAKCQEHEMLETVGKEGTLQTHPFVKRRDKAAEIAMRLASKFGFSPSDRVGLPMPGSSDEGDLSDWDREFDQIA